MTEYGLRQRLLLSDLDAVTSSPPSQEQQETAIQDVLDQIGAFLDQADSSLDDLDQDDSSIVSSAIVRGCQDLAGAVRHMADELDRLGTEERRTLAQACLQDIQQQQQLLRLEHEEEEDEANVNAEEFSLSEMNENDMIRAIEAAGNFLRDVEASLLMVDQDAAEELADVALTVARLFVASLQSVHAQLTPQNLLQQQERQSRQMDIEILSDDNENAVQSREIAGAPTTTKNRTSKRKRASTKRVRVLWPPIGPPVVQCLQWAQQEALKRPILSVALGIVLWPSAVITAMIGTPLVLVDGFVQDFYNHFHDAPLVVGLERGAAQLYHTAKLAAVSGKLVGRQALYILQKQVERHGGMGNISQQCVGMAVDRVLHPVETIQQSWNGLVWSVDQVRHAVEEWQDQERQETVQQLQA